MHPFPWYLSGWLKLYCLFIFQKSFFGCKFFYSIILLVKMKVYLPFAVFFLSHFSSSFQRCLWKIQCILLMYFAFKRLDILFYESVYLWMFSLKIIKELRKLFKFHVCAEFSPINLHNSWHLFKMLLLFCVRFLIYSFLSY